MDHSPHHVLIVSIDTNHDGRRQLAITCKCGDVDTVVPDGQISTEDLRELLAIHLAEIMGRPEIVELEKAIEFLQRANWRDDPLPNIELTIRSRIATDFRTSVEHFSREPEVSLGDRPDYVQRSLFFARFINVWALNIDTRVLADFLFVPQSEKKATS
jgi:hypothetical protein